MKKKFIAIALAALCLASCGAKEINVSDLAATLKNQLTFSEELTEVGEKVTEKRIGLDEADVVQCVAYKGTNAVADEVVVIKTKDVKKVESKLNEYWDKQIKSYESYRPSEVPKLNNGIIYTVNDTVIFCVSENHDAAQKLRNEYANK
ncbi:MAG: DUF4358 domain-containing protein [Clostridia bacterium]|nr:DUF4358 domain-containing protein [Clostridia bacterium]